MQRTIMARWISLTLPLVGQQEITQLNSVSQHKCSLHLAAYYTRWANKLPSIELLERIKHTASTKHVRKTSLIRRRPDTAPCLALFFECHNPVPSARGQAGFGSVLSTSPP